MADHQDWGPDQRRVRPLPPEGDSTETAEPTSTSNVWLFAMLAAALVVVAGWAWWPDSEAPPRRAAAVVTTTMPPITAPDTPPTPEPPAPATTLPPPPSSPIFAATELGDMIWQVVAPTGSSAARWITNPVWTGESFVYLAGNDRLTLNRSTDGLTWDSARTDFDTTEASQLQLAPLDGGLLMTGFGFDRPRAWVSPDGERWQEVGLNAPRPPDAGPISIQWDWTTKGVELPDGRGVLWSGAWFRIRWEEVLDREPFNLILDPEAGRLVVTASPGDSGTAYDVDVTAEDGAIQLRVVDADTGLVVHDSVSALGGFNVELAAMALRDNLATQVWRPIGWVIDPSGAAELLQPAVGGFPTGNIWFTATDDGLITGSSTFVSSLPQPQTFVAISRDGREWDVLPGGAFPAEAWVAGAVSDGDVAVLAGSMWQTVQLADQVSARTQVGIALRSDNGVDWVAHPAGFPAGAFELGGFGAGPLGFAAVNFQCPAGCSYQAFLSADGRTWSQLGLQSPGLATFPITGIAVSTDRVVVLGAAEDGFGVRSNVRAWVGVVDN